MKITRTASGKNTIRMSRSEWERIGRTAGWITNTLGKMQTWFANMLGKIFQNPKANFIASGTNALQQLAQQSQNPQEQKMLNNIASQLKAAQTSQSLSAIKDIMEKATQSLQSINQTPINQTAAAPGTRTKWRKERKKMPKEEPGTALKDFAGLPAFITKGIYSQTEEIATQTNQNVINIANQQVGGVSGATAIKSADMALQVLSTMITGLEGLSSVFSQFSSYVSQAEGAKT